MCLTEKTVDINSLCDSCKAILLNVNLNMDGKLKDFLHNQADQSFLGVYWHSTECLQADRNIY